ncbi:MAG: asparaginase [Bradymonadales bacterium]|jgi:L-asparaginase
MAKILLIHTGGTLSMAGEKHLEPADYAAALLESLPEFVGFAQITSKILYNLDSSDLGPEEWEEIARCIAINRNDYDGFIVIHGTDTMPYTASALAFALEGLDRPVILTGAQRPLGALRNDARRNIADSIELATMPITEVGICFDGVLLRGCRSIKHNSQAYHAFDSPGCEPLAKVGVDIVLGGHIRKPIAPFRCQAKFDANVVVLHVTPGLSPDILRSFIDSAHEPLNGIVLVPFGVGTVPTRTRALAPVVQRATDLGIDVFLANAATGKLELELYENSKVLLDAGAISGGEICMQAALVKLMHACAIFKDREERHAYLRWNVAGELG